MWLSGFFGLAAIAHLARYVAGFTLVVGGRTIPLATSGMIAAAAAALSVVLTVIALKRPCDKACKSKKDEGHKKNGGCCFGH